MTLVLTVIFGVTTVIGLGVSVHYGRRSARLEKRLESFDWEEVLVGVTDLAGEVKSFGVDLIYAMSMRGAIVSYFLTDVLPTSPPVIVGIQQWTDEAPLLEEVDGYEMVETVRSRVQIPDGLKALKDRKLLIVDDLALSGDALVAVRERIVDWGFERENTKTLTLVATNIAVRNGKAPDAYWQAVDRPGFFPWGRAR